MTHARCPYFGGQCIHTGDHDEHETAPITIPAPTGLLYSDLLWIALTDNGNGPAAVVGVGGDDVSLDARAFLAFVDQLESVVTPLHRMSARLTASEARVRARARGW